MTPRESAFRAIERALGATHVLRDGHACSGYALGGMVPEAVAMPTSVEQAAEVLAHAAAGGLSLVPWGGASGADPGLAASCAAPARYDLALSLARLDAIVEHDTDNLTLIAQGGARLFDVAHRLRPERQVLALGWPGSHHTLGGWVAANRSVPKRLAYGAARDQLLGVRLALAGHGAGGESGRGGQLMRFGGKVLKNVAGYDISKLVIGSLGTAGMIVETTWKLFALPDEEAYWGCAFPSLEHGQRFALALLRSALLPACVFLLDPAAATRFATLEGVPWRPGAALAWVGFDGRSAALRRQIADVSGWATQEGGTLLLPRDQLGAAAGAYLMGEGEPAPAFQFRVGAPPASLGAVVASLTASLASALGESSPGDTPPARPETVLDYPAGRITLRIPQAPVNTDALAAWVRAARESLARRQGHLVIERAPSALRRGLGTWGETAGVARLMRAVQGQFDPQRVLTPERLFS